MSPVELSHVIEQCILVGEVEIVLEFCIYFESIGVVLLCFSRFIWILERTLDGLCHRHFVVCLFFATFGLRLFFIRSVIDLGFFILVFPRWILRLHERLQEIEVLILLPLRPQEIVLCKILFVQLQIHSLIVQTGWQNDISILIMIE